MHLTVDVDEREQVATHPAQVRPRDRDRSVGCDGRIDGVATPGEHLDACRRGEVVR